VTLPVAVLAGGLATRLHPITETIPKSLLNVAKKPFVFHQLDWLCAQGIDTVVLCVGHLGEMIVSSVGNGEKFGIKIEYSFDGGTLLGTGGAIKKAAPQLGDAFFVLYGDSYLQCNLPEIERAFNTARKPALMTVFRNDGRWDRSNALYRSGSVLRYDKRSPTADMRFIDYGLSVMRTNALTNWRENAFDLSDLFSTLSSQGELAGFEAEERFYEIGSTQGMAETEHFLLQKETS
jgi:NDP-sugar pyrophosphorylase family protein